MRSINIKISQFFICSSKWGAFRTQFVLREKQFYENQFSQTIQLHYHTEDMHNFLANIVSNTVRTPIQEGSIWRFLSKSDVWLHLIGFHV